MSSLIEICNSAYKHDELITFGKKYYRTNNDNAIICEECIEAWLLDSTQLLSLLIEKWISKVPIVDMSNSHIGSSTTLREDMVHYDLTINAPLYMSIVLGKEFRVYVSFLYTKYEDGVIGGTSYGKIDIFFSNYQYTLTLRDTDTLEVLAERIKIALKTFIDLQTELIPDDEVQMLMDAKANPQYSSACAVHIPSGAGYKCCICNKDTSNEYYIYENKIYCLDDMYDIVVVLSIAANIGDEVGLSIDETSFNNSYIEIRTTPEWKRSVIDKFKNVMKTDRIIHVMIQYQ